MIHAIRLILRSLDINARTEIFSDYKTGEFVSVICNPANLERAWQILENTGYLVKAREDRSLVVTRHRTTLA
jgi:hypothetical protein